MLEKAEFERHEGRERGMASQQMGPSKAFGHQRRGVTQNTEGDNDKSPARSDRSGSYGIRGKVRKGLTRVHSARVGLLK